MIIECPECKGTGMAEPECHECEGNGWLREEVKEFVNTDSREELGDVLAVVRALSDHLCSWDDLLKIEAEKAGQRGVFDNGVFMVSATSMASSAPAAEGEKES